MRMSNETYAFWKRINRYVLPALGALYFGLTKIWGLPYGAEIEGTIALVNTFLAAVLKVSTDTYNAERSEDGGV